VVECPKTSAEIASNDTVQQIAKGLLVASEADGGREYGAHIVRDQNGNLSVTNVTRGVNGRVDLPAAPANAIAEIHTHPDQRLSGGARLTFETPSGNDAQRANAFHIYGVVVTPRTLLVVPVDRFEFTRFKWDYNSPVKP
jgi:hypothetical protein